MIKGGIRSVKMQKQHWQSWWLDAQQDWWCTVLLRQPNPVEGSRGSRAEIAVEDKPGTHAIEAAATGVNWLSPVPGSSRISISKGGAWARIRLDLLAKSLGDPRCSLKIGELFLTSNHGSRKEEGKNRLSTGRKERRGAPDFYHC